MDKVSAALDRTIRFVLGSFLDSLLEIDESLAPSLADFKQLVDSSGPLDADSLKTCAYNFSAACQDLIARQKALKTVETAETRTEVRYYGGPVEIKPEGLTSGAPAETEAMTDVLLGEPVKEWFRYCIEQLSSIRGVKHHERTLALRQLLEGRLTLGQAMEALTDLIIKIRDGFLEDRSQAHKKIADILSTLEATERDFVRTLGVTTAYLEKNEGDFNTAMEDGLKQISSLVSDPVALDVLIGRILEKVASLSARIQEKKTADAARLSDLVREREAAETRLTSFRRDYEKFSRQSREMMKEIEELKAISLRDSLTGIYNRRAYDRQIVKTIDDHQCGMLRTFTLIVFDVDHFRSFNNDYGHLVGDRVLSYVANLAQEHIRSDDFLFRYGGDEFVIILPNAALKAAERVAEKIRRTVENVEFKLSRKSEKVVKVTTSMGVTESRERDDAASIFARADEALYKAKESGRNQVVSI